MLKRFGLHYRNAGWYGICKIERLSGITIQGLTRFGVLTGTLLSLLLAWPVWRGSGEQQSDGRVEPLVNTGRMLRDINGITWRLSGRPGPTACLVFLCGCPACADFARRLHETGLDVRSQGLVAVVTGGRETALRVRDGSGLSCPMLVDADATVTESFHALVCPQVRLIGGDGRILFANSPDRSGDPRQLIAQLLRRLAGGKWRQPR